MTTKTKKPTERNIDLARELRNEAENWVNRTFNFIQLEAFEAVAKEEGIQLFEQVRQKELTWESLADYEGHYGDKKWIKKQQKEYPNLEDHPSYDMLREESEQDNYPMWNTLFEFRNEPADFELAAAIEAGCGVIDAFGPFNITIFMTSAGHSFYSAYWIPMYLAMPYNEDVRKKYKNVDYSGM